MMHRAGDDEIIWAAPWPRIRPTNARISMVTRASRARAWIVRPQWRVPNSAAHTAHDWVFARRMPVISITHERRRLWLATIVRSMIGWRGSNPHGIHQHRTPVTRDGSRT